MSTKQKLEESLKDAMRANDTTRKNTIRIALTNLKLAEVEKGGSLDENAQLALIQKEIKMRQEAIEEAKKGNRYDLVEKNQSEIQVLEGFLPKQLSESELREMTDHVIQDVGAKSPADMGKVMKVLLGQVQGRAAGDQVSRIVREQLLKQE